MIALDKKRILITGASSGIGRALAFGLAEKGAELILTARNAEKLKAIADLIGNKNSDIPRPLVVSCDLTDRKEIKRLFRECLKNRNKLDILINNAGIGVYGETKHTGIGDFKDIMEVNYFGAVECMLEVLPSMIERKEGMIVNICSLAAIHGVPYLGAYGASKAALMALTQSMRAELNRFGIVMMVAYPGYTETDFFKNEKKVDKTSRPKGPYTPADKVAGEIVRSIENKTDEHILTMEGRTLAIARVFFPGMVKRAMTRIANNLNIKN